MKISFSVTVEMTPEQVADYVREYGLADAKAATVRADVKQSLLTGVQDCSAGEFWTASLR